MLFPGLEPEPLVEELRTRLVEEPDYTMEPDHQRLFAHHYRGHPFIHVPEVVSELSTQRVLTTALPTGGRFDQMEQWSHAESDTAHQALFHLVFRAHDRIPNYHGRPTPPPHPFPPCTQAT